MPHSAIPAAALALLRCPRCQGALGGSGGGLACGGCGAVVPVRDGIADIVDGTADTGLDAAGYDQAHAITAETALRRWDTLRAVAPTLWPDGLGRALEVGCGTGRMTLGMLARLPLETLVVTDVSPAMLRQCRARVESERVAERGKLAFATWAGRESCFAPASFDTCFGLSVVHHILDVPRFLGLVHELLRPGGRAFFVEPNARYHHALVATLADVVVGLDGLAQSDLWAMLNWMGSVYASLSNSGDLHLRDGHEDKHQFTAEGFEATARAAGFQATVALPTDPDPTGIQPIRACLRQSGVSAPALARVLAAWPQAQSAHFSRLGARDVSPSLLFWLGKAAPSVAVAGGLVHLWLRLARRAGELAVDGWYLSTRPVGAVALSADGATARLAVGAPRPDVNAAVNADGSFAPLQALCCGVRGTVRLAGTRIAVKGIAIDGQLLPGGTIEVPPDGTEVVLEARIAL